MRKLTILFLLLCGAIYAQAQVNVSTPTYQAYTNQNIFDVHQKKLFLDMSVSYPNKTTDINMLVPSQSAHLNQILFTNSGGTATAWRSLVAGFGLVISSSGDTVSANSALRDTIPLKNLGTGTFYKIANAHLDSLLFKGLKAGSGTTLAYTTDSCILISNSSTSASGPVGAVQWAGTGGVFHNNDANFHWDSAGAELGIGTNVPTSLLHVFKNSIQRNGKLFLAEGNQSSVDESFSIHNDGSLFRNGNLYSVGADATGNNTSFGLHSLDSIQYTLGVATGASSNIAFGDQSGRKLKTGSFNTFMGFNAGANGVSDSANTFLGYRDGINTTASYNTAIGYSSMTANITGKQNVAVGANAMVRDSSNNNTAVGYNAITTSAHGVGNIAMGHGVGTIISTGSGLKNGTYNILIGTDSTGGNVSDSSWNVYVGAGAGYLVRGSENTFIGAHTFSTSLTTSRQSIALGFGAIPVSNQLMIQSAAAPINNIETNWSSTGVNDIFLRSTSPENSQAAQQGSLALVNDATNGHLFVKATNTNNKGWVDLVPLSADVTAHTTAIGSLVTLTTPNDVASHQYRIGGYVNITAVTTDVVQLQVVYTDENGNSVTLPLTMSNISGVLGINANAGGQYSAFTMTIRSKSNSAITVKTVLTVSSGSITYDVGGNIQQVN